jgi:hypothetical protein
MIRTARLLVVLALVGTLTALLREGRPAVLLAQETQKAQELYQRALVQEHARGNLQEAIALYEQAARAAGTDRALAARALIRIAGAREKLGQRTKAADTYAEVMRAFPEQRDDITIAQARLNVLRGAPPERVSDSSREEHASPASTVRFFERYCTQCHNETNKSGGLDFAALNSRSIGASTAVWEKILARLQARRDPPAPLPRPDDHAYRAVVATLQQTLDTAYATTRSPDVGERVSDAELAERLASFLWNAAPDEALLNEARRGRLHDPLTLNHQVTRMLRDPKSARLVDGFFTSWLSLDKIKTIQPDAARYPQFDADLLQAMESETRLFLESQLRDDRDALEVWTADYTFVNERLARHYGLPGITGREFRRVTWPDPTRAGILGQAGPLAALAFPARTSPTVRGRFVLAKFLGINAPDPPANVPPLAERPATPGTMRDRMLAHKLSPSCANCHVLFDPLGLALENFDSVGGWRTMDAGAPIDASGAFPDGTRFNGPAELRAGLLRFRDAYYTNLTRQLLAWALKRSKAGNVYDFEMPAVRRIVRDASRNGNRWSSLLAGIAASDPFQTTHIVP